MGTWVSQRVWPSSLCPLPLFFLFEGLRLSGRFWVVDPDRKVKDWAHSGLLQQLIYRPPPRPAPKAVNLGHQGGKLHVANLTWIVFSFVGESRHTPGKAIATARAWLVNL